jgi:hypothetical protein
MNYVDRNRLEAFLRIGQFVPTTGFVPNARGVVLFGSIATAVTQMQTYATKQSAGKGERHAGTIERERIGDLLRAELVDIGNTGRSLDPEEYPGVGAKFRLSASDNSYQTLRATAQAYLEAVGPVKAAFVEREYAADFDEKLADLIEAFDEATQDTDAGLQEQSGGTAGLRVVSSRALKAVRELDAMITKKLRTSNPAQLQVWKNASRVERRSAPTAPTPPPVAVTASLVKREPQLLVANGVAPGVAPIGLEVNGAESVERPV